MTAQIINGKQVSEQCIARVAEQVAQRKAAGLRVPGLAVVLVGDDPASAVYVRNKQLACDKAALKSFSHILPAATTEAELLTLIDEVERQSRSRWYFGTTATAQTHQQPKHFGAH